MRIDRMAESQDQLLSLADIARHFNLPESTARYYCKRFAAFMPTHGEGRRRRYRAEALAVVSAILEHMQNAKTASAVEQLLGQQFPRTTEAVLPAKAKQRAPQSPALSSSEELTLTPAFAITLMERPTMAMPGITSSLQVRVQIQHALQA